ncbi:MAG: carboxypeptidase-like regulatory domain-containing protein [Thermoanaerobaculia bacterium]
MANPPAPPISGVVRHLHSPVSGALVIFYNLGDTSLIRSRTSNDGTFVLASAPIGVYDLIAYKKGFLPALIRVWHQAIPEKVSSVEIALLPQRALPGSPPKVTDIWEVRSRIPSDVLREIDLEESGETDTAEGSGPGDRVGLDRMIGGEVRTVADVAGTENSLSRTAVGVRGGLPNGWKYQLRGEYSVLSEEAGDADAFTTGNSAGLALDVAPSSDDRLRVASRRNSISFGEAQQPASFQTHALSWSRGGEEGRVESIGARYIEEANLYRATSLGTTFFPLASRTWELQARYGRPAADSMGVSVAMTYRHRESTVGPSGVGSEGAFFNASPDADLSAATSVRVSSRGELEGGVVGRYVGGGYSIAPRLVARYDLGRGTLVFVRAMSRVMETETLNGTVLPRVASIEDNMEPASREAFAAGLEHRSGEDTSVRFEVSDQQIEEVVRAFFEGDFLTDFDSVYLFEGNRVQQFQASGRHRLSDSVAGSVAVRYGEITGDLSPDLAGSYGISESGGHFWSARAAVEVLPTRTGVALLVRGVRQGLQTASVAHSNDSDKLAVSVAQDLSVMGITPFGSICKLLVALESARNPLTAERKGHDDEEAPKTSRLMGGVALSF